MVLFFNFRNHKLYMYIYLALPVLQFTQHPFLISKSKKKRKATTLTFAVATCPSVSSLSIVPVGKYGTIAVNDRANNLEEIEFNLKWTTFNQLGYSLPIIWVPKVEFKLVLGCSKPTWEFYKWQKAAQTQLLVNGSSPKIWLQVRKEREKSQL